jgi:AIPR protein
MATISKMDYSIIDARVKKAIARHGLKTNSVGLLHVVLEQLFPSILELLPEVITDGGDDRGVDAIHIVESEDVAEIYLVQSKYRENQSSCDRTINDSEIMKISLFLNELFDQSETLKNSYNLRLNEAVKRIWDIHAAGKVCRYNVTFISNGNGFSHTAKNIINSTTTSHPSVSFDFYGAPDIIRGLQHEGLQRESGKLQVIGKEILERSDGDVRGVIASVDARSFVELIKTPDGEGIKRHLFDDNLRVFLGVKGGYNSSIIATATSSDSYLFWYLNNGITITCKNFSYNKGHVNPSLALDSFQIVNGAQTSHSLFEAFRAKSENLENVVLMVRVYATERPDIAERVAVATNSQARIQARDLRANASVLKKLELAFKEQGYYFERKRNMHSEQSDDKRIDALKLGQIILSYDLREPDRAKSESDSIFDNRFETIFHDKQDVERLAKLFALYRIIENLRDKYYSENSENVESGHPHQYLVYGHWFILFACGLLVVKSHGGQIPTDESALQLVEEAILLVANSCSQQKAVAHYQIFRSSKTKDKIIAEISGKQLDFLNLLLAN